MSILKFDSQKTPRRLYKEFIISETPNFGVISLVFSIGSFALKFLPLKVGLCVIIALILATRYWLTSYLSIKSFDFLKNSWEYQTYSDEQKNVIAWQWDDYYKSWLNADGLVITSVVFILPLLVFFLFQ